MRLSLLFYAIPLALRLSALLYPAFRERLKQRDLVAQLKLQDDSKGRFIEIKNGRVHSRSAIHPSPDVTLVFKNERVALRVLTPPQDYGELVHAGKTFQMGALGERRACLLVDADAQHDVACGMEVRRRRWRR